MRNLVKRYIAYCQRMKQQDMGVSEDDVNEIKQDISAFRFELLDVLKRAGMDTGHSNTAQKGTARSKKRSAQAERRLMKGFQLNVDPIPEVDRFLPKAPDVPKSSVTSATAPDTLVDTSDPGLQYTGVLEPREESPESESGNSGLLGGFNRLKKLSRKFPSVKSKNGAAVDVERPKLGKATAVEMDPIVSPPMPSFREEEETDDQVSFSVPMEGKSRSTEPPPYPSEARDSYLWRSLVSSQAPSDSVAPDRVALLHGPSSSTDTRTDSLDVAHDPEDTLL